MIRWYFKYRIRCAIEQTAKLPGWVQRRMNDDSELLRYAKDYARMTQQLSSSAADWIQSETLEPSPEWSEEVASRLQLARTKSRNTGQQPDLNPSVNRPARIPNTSTLRWGVCVIGTILLTFGFLAMRKRALQTATRHESIEKTQMAMTVTKAMLEKGQSVAGQSFDAYERTLHKVSRNLVDDLGDSALAPIETGGRWLGDVMIEFHSGAMREQNQLIEMWKGIGSRFEK